MTQREKEILHIIKKDPMISQQEIADLLNINRSSVAVHIANLMKKGYIKGKGYIVKEEKMVCVIGGSNIDLQGFPNEKLTLMDSNQGKIETSLGGVGRNIAENLARLSVPVRLLSAVGDDFYGQKLMEESSTLGIDLKNMFISKEHPTSMYLSIMDEDHDMKVAISQMDVYEKMDKKYIQDNHLLIKNSNLIVLDANIPQNTIDYISSLFQETPIFVDPVSTVKAMRLKNSMGKYHTIKPNIYEVSKLLDMEIHTINDVRKAGEILLSYGIKRAFISMGKDGVFACDKDNELLVKAKIYNIKSATGAGDAFMAGLVSGYLKGKTLEEATVYSTGASILALKSYHTINPVMSEDEVLKILDNTEIQIKIY